MFAITDLGRIDYFEREARIISIFLASRFDKTTVDWLFYSWSNLHRLTGHSWHLLVPTIEPIDDKLKRATSENFNSDLARELLSWYGIDPQKTPCIVFDDLNEEKPQHYVSLGEHTEAQLKRFFYDCARIVEQHDSRKDAMPPGQWRSQVIGELFNLSQAKKYIGVLKKLPILSTIGKFVHPPNFGAPGPG